MKFLFHYRGQEIAMHIESIVDLAALHEVFVLEEYDWELSFSPKIILDLGAHFGDTALYYHLRYPDAQIFAIEPAPETFKRLEKNVSSIKNITAIQAGISEKDGFADLYIMPSSLGSSLKERKGTKNTVRVPVYTLDSLLKTCKISRADLIKFDIEGAEESLFVTGQPENFARAYIGEVHADLISVDKNVFISQFAGFKMQTEDLSSTSRCIIKAIQYD